MKKNRKLILTAILAVLMTMLWGCGGEGGSQDETDGYVYVPEYVQMDVDCTYINSVTSLGDSVIMNAIKWDEESQESSNFLYRYDLAKGEGETIPLAVGEDDNIGAMTAGADGSLAMVVNSYTYETDENGEPTNYKSSITLWSVSAEDGSIKSQKDINEVFGNSQDGGTYVQNFCVDGQGNFYLDDGNNTIYVLDQDMNKICEIKADNWIRCMAASKEGDVYISTYGENGLEMRKVDIAAKKLGEPQTGLASGYGNQDFITGSTKSFLMDNRSQVSLYDLSTQTEEALFSWLDVDINSDNVSQRGELSDGRVWALTRDYGSEGADGPEFELILLSRKEASQVPQKEKIVYGAMWVDSNVKKAIIDFNKTSDKYRITVKEYGEAVEDYQAAQTQFNADLTTADCPDIIGLNSLDYHLYASKGVLEDLYPYMEKSGINKADYLENILGAYESDGKLYGLIPAFYVSTTMAKASQVGDKTGWTLSEMLEFAEGREENLFAYGSRSSIFYYCIYNNIDEFIDWESGKCFFDSEDFIKTLEFAAKYPEEYDYQADREEGISSRIRSDKVLLLDSSISSVQEFQMLTGMFGEKVSFLGYPNSERKGNLVQATGGCMGLSSKSKHKEGAWEFMQRLLSEEYQDSMLSEHGNSFGFPVKKSALEKQFELDMTPDYFEDEDGNKTENAKTSWGWDDFQMDIMAATQEEVDAVRSLIESAEKVSGSVDEQLVNIITEESEPFFKGQKSAADVAGIIQNRIQIYVNENS